MIFEMVAHKGPKNLTEAFQAFSRVDPRGLSESAQEAYHRAYEILKNARYANYDSGDGRKKLRVLARYLRGEWSSDQAAEALGWEEERVAEEAQEWLQTDHKGVPLSECWLRPPDHPWIAQARKIAEAEADRRDALRSRLLLRMKVAGGVVGEKEAAELAELSLPEWQLFCKAEDVASSEKDREYREGWVLNYKEEDKGNE